MIAVESLVHAIRKVFVLTVAKKKRKRPPKKLLRQRMHIVELEVLSSLVQLMVKLNLRGLKNFTRKLEDYEDFDTVVACPRCNNQYAWCDEP